MTQAIAAALSSLNAAEKAAAMISGNIANSDTDGYKSFRATYTDIMNTDGRSSGGVVLQTRATTDMQGSVRTTGVETDITIDGSGMFIVTDPNREAGDNAVAFTKAGSYRMDVNGNLALPSGHVLNGWQIDENGNLPAVRTITESLTPINIQRLISEASATSKITMAFNLNSTQETAGGGQITFDIINSGTKASPYNAFIKSTDVLYANPNNNLTIGEGISVRTATVQENGKVNSKVTPIEYGGFAQTLTFSNTGIELVGAAQTFNITVGGSPVTISRGTGTNNLAVMQNIVNQINQTTGNNALTARIINGGSNSSILIAPKDANKGMIFTGVDSFRNDLGLTDFKNTLNSATGVKRFASLANLKDALNDIGDGIEATVSSDENASITLKSSNSLLIDNYQLGSGSDFMSEFNITAGFVKSAYDPYDAKNNMASGTFQPHYSKDVVVYDAMGNPYNFLVSLMKTDVNTWAAEVYSMDKTVVEANGRVDGLVQAGTVTFDGSGRLKAYIPAVQRSVSNDVSVADAPLGATNGQTMSIRVGTTTHTYTYHDAIITGDSIAGAGAALSGGAAGDTLVIDVGGTTHTFTRGTGANSLAILNNIASQINATTGPEALRATVKDLGAGNYALAINPLDVTLDVVITTGTLGTDLGITAVDDLAADTSRYRTLYELAERINDTSGADSLKAKVIPGKSGAFKIQIEPVEATAYMAFSGSSAIIGSPLGDGTANTINEALGLKDTNATKRVASLDEEVTIQWSDAIKADNNVIKFNFGEVGQIDGITQINQAFITRKMEQDGAVTGELSSIKIDKEGYVVANFTNGKVRQIYKLAIADFVNANGLLAVTDTLFIPSKDSGPLTLKEAGIDGAGSILSRAVEGSNVNISDELAELIQVQRRYQASAKVINIADKLYEELIHRTFA